MKNLRTSGIFAVIWRWVSLMKCLWRIWGQVVYWVNVSESSGATWPRLSLINSHQTVRDVVVILNKCIYIFRQLLFWCTVTRVAGNERQQITHVQQPTDTCTELNVETDDMNLQQYDRQIFNVQSKSDDRHYSSWSLLSQTASTTECRCIYRVAQKTCGHLVSRISETRQLIYVIFTLLMSVLLPTLLSTLLLLLGHEDRASRAAVDTCVMATF